MEDYPNYLKILGIQLHQGENTRYPSFYLPIQRQVIPRYMLKLEIYVVTLLWELEINS